MTNNQIYEQIQKAWDLVGGWTKQDEQQYQLHLKQIAESKERHREELERRSKI